MTTLDQIAARRARLTSQGASSAQNQAFAMLSKSEVLSGSAKTKDLIELVLNIAHAVYVQGMQDQATILQEEFAEMSLRISELEMHLSGVCPNRN